MTCFVSSLRSGQYLSLWKTSSDRNFCQMDLVNANKTANHTVTNNNHLLKCSFPRCKIIKKWAFELPNLKIWWKHLIFIFMVTVTVWINCWHFPVMCGRLNLTLLPIDVGGLDTLHLRSFSINAMHAFYWWSHYTPYIQIGTTLMHHLFKGVIDIRHQFLVWWVPPNTM